MPTPAIRNLIREGKTHQIYSAIQTSGATGMQTMDAHLAQLVRQGKITAQARRAAGLGPEELQPPARQAAGGNGAPQYQRRRRLAGHAGLSGVARLSDEHLRVPRNRPRRHPLDAASSRRTRRRQVTEQLRQRGLIVLDVSEKREAFKIEDFFDRLQGVNMRELAVFSRQFATLVASGMPMLRSLHTLEEQTEDEKIKEAIVGLRNDVEAGSSLAAAMERQPEVFDPLYRSMVRSGEGSGRLEEALDRVAFQLEKLDALRRQVRSAMMYPALVFGFAVDRHDRGRRLHRPGLRRHLRRARRRDARARAPTLPFLTQITVSVSDADHRLLVHRHPASSACSRSLFFQWKKTERGRDQWDRFKLRLPFKIGDVIQKVALARWSRTFSGTISAGVPMLQAIKLTGETVGQRRRRGGDGGRLRLGQAGRLDRRPDRAAPTSSRRWSATWSRSARRPASSSTCSSKVADFYEAEVDAKVKALTSLIEPVMIVFVGGVVGFIVISMYLPIFSLYDKIR